jgi:hypothetical protein
MDEMTLLEEFRAVVAPPDDVTLVRARARMLDGAVPGQGSRGVPWLRPAGRRGKLALTGVAATATIAAASVALAAHGGGPSRPGAASPVVRELAYRAAAAAGAQPDVKPGQWVYWQEKAYSSPDSGPAPNVTFEVWTTADAANAAYLSKGKVAFFPCGQPGPKPDSGCQSIGQPVIVHSDDGDFISGLSGKIPVPYAGLSSLPSSPLALDRYLAGLHLPGWGPAPVREFEVIKELLTTYVMPPGLTAELYRALGNIPGVTVDQHAVDVAGRRGIGFGITLPAAQGGVTDELILDPKTFGLMGQQLTLGRAAGAQAGQVLSGTAILKTALVSGPGILP